MKKVIKSNIPIYLVGITWFLYAMIFPLYRIVDYIIVASLSVIVYIIAVNKIKPKVVDLPSKFNSSGISNREINTGNPELDNLLTQGAEHVRTLQSLSLNIADQNIVKNINDIILICDKIFAVVEKQPEKVKDIRIFINYYLPTTIDLLKSYHEMNRQASIGGKTITTTLQKIVSSLDTIVSAFRNLLDSLYGEKAMDVNANITVLKNMLEREGLVDSEISKKDQLGNISQQFNL